MSDQNTTPQPAPASAEQRFVTGELNRLKSIGDPSYARFRDAAAADGYDVGDHVSPTTTIVHTAPSATGYPTAGADDFSRLTSKQLTEVVASMRAHGFSENRIQSALAESGLSEVSATPDNLNAEQRAYNQVYGPPPSPADYKIDYGIEGRQASPEDFRTFDTHFRSALHGLGVSPDLAQAVLADLRASAQAYQKVVQGGEAAYTAHERNIIAQVVGAHKVDETIAAASVVRAELARINPELSKQLEALGAFNGARITVRLSLIADRLAHAGALAKRRGR